MHLLQQEHTCINSKSKLYDGLNQWNLKKKKYIVLNRLNKTEGISYVYWLNIQIPFPLRSEAGLTTSECLSFYTEHCPVY